jgi:hypothetical protein
VKPVAKTHASSFNRLCFILDRSLIVSPATNKYASSHAMNRLRVFSRGVDPSLDDFKENKLYFASLHRPLGIRGEYTLR